MVTEKEQEKGSQVALVRRLAAKAQRRCDRLAREGHETESYMAQKEASALEAAAAALLREVGGKAFTMSGK